MSNLASFSFRLLRQAVLAGVVLACGAVPAIAGSSWSLLINTNNIIVVTNPPYNAAGDGVTTNTAAIQSAINAVASGGVTNGLRGGLVEIPAGTFLCGPLTMASNVRLQLDTNSIVRLLPYNSYPGAPTNVVSFITGTSLTNIAITGTGGFDGQGAPWWPGYTTNSRPLIISLSRCSEVLLQDFTSSNPPAQHISIKGANAGNVDVIDVKLFAPASEAPVNPSHNTDGVDFAETNGLFENCVISTGDDNLAFGSSASISWDILVTNCFFGSGHGCSIGSYTSGGVSNITVVSCIFSNTDCGIKIKSERDRGGLVQNLNYDNLSMSNVQTAVMFYSYYELGEGTLDSLTPPYVANYSLTSPNPSPYEPPIYQNITVSNVTATISTASHPPILFMGLPDHPINNVLLKSVNLISGTTENIQIYNTTNLQLLNCSMSLPPAATVQCWNGAVTFTNSLPGANLLFMDGLTTNDIGNTLAYDNANATLSDTNAIAAGGLMLCGSILTISNNLQVTSATPLNYVLGTDAATVAVKGALALGGTVNIAAGNGFTNGAYTLLTYTGLLSGSPPTLGSTPPGYNYAFNTGTAGQVNLIVTLPAPFAPANLVARGTNLMVGLQWSESAGATGYNVMRSTTNGGPYSSIATAAATNYSDTAVNPGTTYYYVVSATNSSGSSPDSSQAGAVPLPSLTATNLDFQFSGNQLQLSWPSDHLGWELQIQTNSLTAGLRSNWVTLSGSSNVISTNIIINPDNGSVFLRLVYP